MTGMCQTMASGLRLYGHPQLLAVAASINGDDFVPYNDAIFIKQPGQGGGGLAPGWGHALGQSGLGSWYSRL